MLSNKFIARSGRTTPAVGCEQWDASFPRRQSRQLSDRHRPASGNGIRNSALPNFQGGLWRPKLDALPAIAIFFWGQSGSQQLVAPRLGLSASHARYSQDNQSKICSSIDKNWAWAVKGMHPAIIPHFTFFICRSNNFSYIAPHPQLRIRKTFECCT
jgi:hypothetical protein